MLRRLLLPILIGLAIGVGIGLFAGWVAWPVNFTDASPSILAAGWKDEAIWMTAQAFAYDNDLEAAAGRLAPIFGNDLGPIILKRAEDAIKAAYPPLEIAHIGRLAAAFGSRSPGVDAYLAQVP